jgi:hypothetical protein
LLPGIKEDLTAMSLSSGLDHTVVPPRNQSEVGIKDEHRASSRRTTPIERRRRSYWRAARSSQALRLELVKGHCQVEAAAGATATEATTVGEAPQPEAQQGGEGDGEGEGESDDDGHDPNKTTMGSRSVPSFRHSELEGLEDTYAEIEVDIT